MRSIPAHKVVGDVDKPGQIVNSDAFDRYPYMKHSTAEPMNEDQVKTLGDYLTRKKRYAALDTLQPINTVKKLAFEDWAKARGIVGHVYYNEYLDCWKAAQENI